MKRARSEVGSNVGGGGERAVRGLLERAAVGAGVKVDVGFWRGRAERINPRQEDMGGEEGAERTFFARNARLDKLKGQSCPAQRENNDICMQGKGANDKDRSCGMRWTEI
jgi:hypothetical protein